VTKKLTTTPKISDKNLYTFEVFIVDGPMTKSFVKKNQVICRTIQIRGDQTLEDFHNTIFEAFDREEEHLYEFQIGGKGPMDPEARRYVLNIAEGVMLTDDEADGNVSETTIASIGLKKDESFGYWFDFGDDWWHQINLISIEEVATVGEYPKVTERIGTSPPQYVNWEEEKV
jgi:Plasmid pRiA4b ORF-3-like protein